MECKISFWRGILPYLKDHIFKEMLVNLPSRTLKVYFQIRFCSPREYYSYFIFCASFQDFIVSFWANQVIWSKPSKVWHWFSDLKTSQVELNQQSRGRRKRGYRRGHGEGWFAHPLPTFKALLIDQVRQNHENREQLGYIGLSIFSLGLQIWS